jgi:uncharacterized protein
MLSGAGFLLGMYAWQVEPYWVELVELPMPIRHLPPALKGKTLMQISDIHTGKRFDHQFIINAFDKASALAPDFVVYTGDYISLYQGTPQYDLLDETLRHAVKGKLGTIAILGNHDYGNKWQEPIVADSITAMMTRYGIRVLRNEQCTIDGLTFIGIDDYWGTNFAPERVMTQLDSSQASLALCHNPDVCDLNVWHGYQGWILSGHTHGGQVKPPFFDPPMLPITNTRYAAGKIDLEDARTLYVNRALGNLWPVRFNVRPEITLFTLDAR